MSLPMSNLVRLPLEHTNAGRLARSPTWQTWRSPTISREELRRGNKLHTRHAPWSLPVGELSAVARPTLPAVLSSPVWIELRIDDRAAALQLESELLDRLTAVLDEGLDWATVPGELQGMLLELALDPWLGAFEQALGRGIEVVGRRETMATGKSRPLHLGIEWDGRVSPARLWLEDVDVAGLAAGWDARQAVPAAWSDLPIAVAYCVARSTFTPAELAGVEIGDVMMIEASFLPHPRLLLIVGGILAVPGEVQGRTVTAAGELHRITSLNGVLRAMSDDRPTEEGQGSAAPLDEIPLRIAFELGRQELPLGELRMIAPGYVFPLDRDLGAAVEIRCGDRRIGVGEIVHIEDQLGVRVVKLFDRG